MHVLYVTANILLSKFKQKSTLLCVSISNVVTTENGH